MKKFEADTLEEVYELASKEFSCSVVDLTIDVIQQPSNGFFGIFGSKKAIILAEPKQNNSKNNLNNNYNKKSFKKRDIKIKDINTNTTEDKQDIHQETQEKDLNFETVKKDEIFDEFYNKDNATNTQKLSDNQVQIKQSKEEVITEIKEKINFLFSKSCFKLDEIIVKDYDEETIYIEFNGEDCALLIGKEGYRYKALSYMIFNWIHETYGYMIRLEVAEFLKNQEESINKYIDSIIDNIKAEGRGQTKPLDGILVHIALTRLRDEFPNKYVAVKTNIKKQKYIVINDFKHKQ